MSFNKPLNRLPGPYSQHFIFFITYKWAQYARVFDPSKPSVMYHSKPIHMLQRI